MSVSASTIAQTLHATLNRSRGTGGGTAAHRHHAFQSITNGTAQDQAATSTATRAGTLQQRSDPGQLLSNEMLQALQSVRLQ